MHWVVTHFLSPGRSFRPSFCTAEKSLLLRLLLLIDLFLLGYMSSPHLTPPQFAWFICALLSWPAARKQLCCPNWTEGNWLALDGDCLDWPLCSRKMLRQHLSTWDGLLIRVMPMSSCWRKGRRSTAWSNRKGRPLNLTMLWAAGRKDWRIWTVFFLLRVGGVFCRWPIDCMLKELELLFARKCPRIKITGNGTILGRGEGDMKKIFKRKT